MTIQDFLSAPGITAIGVLFLSLIQISPIKINPWTWFGKMLQKINGVQELSKRIDKIDMDIESIKDEIKVVDCRNAKTRTRVIREKIITFAHDIRVGYHPSSAQYEEMGRWIDEYNKVSKEYNLSNSFCETEIKYILSRSRERGLNDEMENVG